MKTPQELKTAFPGQAAKFLDRPEDQYDAAHLQAALLNALREIDHLKREVTRLREQPVATQ